MFAREVHYSLVPKFRVYGHLRISFSSSNHVLFLRTSTGTVKSTKVGTCGAG